MEHATPFTCIQFTQVCRTLSALLRWVILAQSFDITMALEIGVHTHAYSIPCSTIQTVSVHLEYL